VITTDLLLRKTGLTYRQIDHWARQGYLRTDPEWVGGTGNARRYLDGEDRIALRMRDLCEIGLKPSAAHRIARGDRQLMMKLDLALAAVRASTDSSS
jgi:DNA-binding transcriptional MerR regulator